MLETALAEQLRGYLTNVVHPVTLVSTLDSSAVATQTAELLDEIVELSGGRIRHDRNGDAARVPSFRIVGSDAQAGAEVEFAGLPLGHEFTSLVLALLQVGGHPSTADAELLDRVRGLAGEHHFETFFSQSCQNCPDVVQALNLMAVLNSGISHTAIDGAAFQDEATERGVLAVPMVFLDGEEFGQGRMSLEEIVARLDTEGEQVAIERLGELAPFDVLVIGGGPAGTTAAMYAARKGIRTGLVAEKMGGQLLDTVTIENYPSVTHTEGARMAADLEVHVKAYDVDLITGQHVAELRPAKHIGGLHEVLLASGAILQAKSVIVAAGARWRTLGVPGEEQYRTRGVTFCPHCDGPLFKGKPVAVIGGGNSGVEAAIDLAGIVSHVTLVEFLDELRADSVLVKTLRSLPNVDVMTGTATIEIVGDTTKVTGLRYAAHNGDQEGELELSGVFVQIGLLPNTDWLKGTLDLSERGEVIIDHRGATSVPGIFAAGDCTTSPYKQIAVAAGAGATAALGAFDHLIRSTEAALAS